MSNISIVVTLSNNAPVITMPGDLRDLDAATLIDILRVSYADDLILEINDHISSCEPITRPGEMLAVLGEIVQVLDDDYDVAQLIQISINFK